MREGEKFVHGEAFRLMHYRCEKNPLHLEIIWNSRDGVTPFVITCRQCGSASQHVEWSRDEFAPDYATYLKIGDRYFRNGRAAEARGFMRERIRRFAEQGLTPEQVGTTEEELMASVEDGYEFQSGWPMLVTVGTDNDMLGQEDM